MSLIVVYIDTRAVATGIVFISNELMTELRLVSLITQLVLQGVAKKSSHP